MSTEALLTSLPHPGTAIYLGYNDDIQNLARSLCNRTGGGSCDPIIRGSSFDAVPELRTTTIPQGVLPDPFL